MARDTSGSPREGSPSVTTPSRIQCHLAALAEIAELAEQIRRIEEQSSFTFQELRNVVFSVEGFRAVGRIDDLVQVVGHAMEIARKMGWTRLLAELANIQGMNQLIKWQPGQAQPLFEQAARLWAEEAVPEEHGRSLINLTQVHFDAGATASAKGTLAEALSVAQSHDLRALEAQTIGFLGAVFFHLEGRYAEASHAFQQAMTLYHDVGDEAGERKIAGRLERLAGELALLTIEWSGVISENAAPLYRGEGRLSLEQAWKCTDCVELAAHLRTAGFATRHPQGHFSGTLADQILQQGYVNQNTVSLTESFEVARNYALGGGTRQQGVVFTIDRGRLSRHGKLYDSYASMRKYLHWFFQSEFETLSTLVKVLDVAEGGAFLERLARETRQLVETNRDLVVSPPTWSSNLRPGRWEQLQQSEIGVERLDSLYHAFRGFWMFASGGVETDRLRLDPEGGAPAVATRPAELFGYYLAFRAVQQQLCDVQAGAGEEHKRNPGWQTTPFGYVAKTCRDREFFSTGGIAPDCIVESIVVGHRGA